MRLFKSLNFFGMGARSAGHEIERLICDMMRRKFGIEKRDFIPICMRICFLGSLMLLHLTARHLSGMF